jgi:hypothetical protein
MMPLSRWPSPGDTVPVTVDGSNPERVEIAWAAVPSLSERARDGRRPQLALRSPP